VTAAPDRAAPDVSYCAGVRASCSSIACWKSLNDFAPTIRTEDLNVFVAGSKVPM
jgi:hypothetical protein